MRGIHVSADKCTPLCYACALRPGESLRREAQCASLTQDFPWGIRLIPDGQVNAAPAKKWRRSSLAQQIRLSGSLMRINMEFKIAEWRWERDRGLARKSGDGQSMKCGVGIWSLNLNFKVCSMKAWKWKSLGHVQLFTTQWTVPLSMGFSRQECCSGLPFPSPGDLPNPGI